MARTPMLFMKICRVTF